MSPSLRFSFARGFAWLAGALALALTLGSGQARADTQIGFDLDYSVPIESIGDSGGGFGIRFGKQLHVPMVVITPEVVFAYHSFSGRGDPATYKGVLGLRLGLGEIFRIGPFAHLGVGHQDLDLAGDPNYTGFCYDAGLFFDLTIIPFLNVGVHGAYNQLSGSDEPTFHWATFGAHAELIF
jgi:hypothetical protein